MLKCNKTWLMLICITALVYVYTAWQSTGYFHADEHFQILEFAAFKAGNVPAHEMAWEYQAELRPALQPTIAYFFIKACNYFSITSPFNQAKLLRFLSALLFLLVTIPSIQILKHDFFSKKSGNWFIMLQLFLWFIPFFAVRFSSETWSAIFFFGALVCIHFFKSDVPFWRFLLAGILMGFAFEFRFQSGILILFSILWWLIIRRKLLKRLPWLLVGLGIALTFGFYIDTWFYGKTVFTPWNYLTFNVLEGQSASVFGSSPWWYYFSALLEKSGFIPGLLILGSAVFFLFKEPKHLFNWLWLSFLSAHILLGHKELRFLFPLIPLSAYFVGQFIQWLWANIKKQSLRYIINIFLSLLVIENLVLLIWISSGPACQPVKFLEFVYKNKDQNNLIYYNSENPLSPFNLPIHFYTSQVRYEVKKIDTIPDITKDLKDFENIYVYLKYRSCEKENLPVFKNRKILYRSIPNWLTDINFNHWLDRTMIYETGEITSESN